MDPAVNFVYANELPWNHRGYPVLFCFLDAFAAIGELSAFVGMRLGEYNVPPADSAVASIHLIHTDADVPFSVAIVFFNQRARAIAFRANITNATHVFLRQPLQVDGEEYETTWDPLYTPDITAAPDTDMSRYRLPSALGALHWYKSLYVSYEPQAQLSPMARRVNEELRRRQEPSVLLANTNASGYGFKFLLHPLPPLPPPAPPLPPPPPATPLLAPAPPPIAPNIPTMIVADTSDTPHGVSMTVGGNEWRNMEGAGPSTPSTLLALPSPSFVPELSISPASTSSSLPPSPLNLELNLPEVGVVAAGDAAGEINALGPQFGWGISSARQAGNNQRDRDSDNADERPIKRSRTSSSGH